MRVGLIGAPWRVRWFVTALLAALFLAAISAVSVLDVAHSAGWAWSLVILGTYSLVFAAATRVRLLSMDQRRARRWHRTSRWLSASTDAEGCIALPPQRLWLPALVAIIAGMAIVTLVVVSDRPTPTPKRRTANVVNTGITAHPKMLDASLITLGDPSPSRYEAIRWLASVNLPPLAKALHDANITTPDQQAAFLAQIAEESGELAMVNELPWGLPRSQWDDEQAVRDYFNNKYADVNGNGGVSSGDGYNYRGRGVLQITGKSNYAVLSEKLYGDDRLVANPDLLSQPDAAWASAAAYWNENNLNRFIPPGQPVTPQEFQDLGSTINTGHPGDVPNNAAERVKYWEVTKEALGVK